MFVMPETLHVNPTKEDRKPTNRFFIFVFSFIFFLWIALVLKVLNDSSVPQKGIDLDSVIYVGYIINSIIQIRLTWIFPVCTIFSGLIAFAYVYFLSRDDGVMITIIAKYLLLIPGAILAVVTFLLVILLISESILSIFLFFILLFGAVFFIVSFRCSNNVGNKAIFEIIQDASKAIINLPKISIFAITINLAPVLILTFLVFILKSMIFANYSSTSLKINVFLIIYGARALLNLCENFIHIVISGYIIDWFWMKDRSSIGRNIGRALSFHLGTLALASLPFVSHVISLIQILRPRDSDKDIIKIYDVFTRLCSQACVTFNIVSFSLIQTAIYGYDYSTATLAAHDIVAQNNHELNLAVTMVSLITSGIGIFFITIPFHIDVLNYSIFYTVIPLYVVLNSVIHALLVNKMIIDYTSETVQEGSNSAQKAVLPRPPNNV